jgi:hypothetical protein
VPGVSATPPQPAAAATPTKTIAARDAGLPIAARLARAPLQTPKPSGNAASQKGHTRSAPRTCRAQAGQG